MNPGSAAGASSGQAPSQKKDRGAVAIQACETCRARKHKCDENRPKCGLCQRMKLECIYREPVPTKKDKTLVDILISLKRLEGKVDRISSAPFAQSGFGPPQVTPASHPVSPFPAGSVRQSQPQSPSARSPPYRHISAAQKLLTWPAIQNFLAQTLAANTRDFNTLEVEGPAFVKQVQEGIPGLPLEVALSHQPFVGMQMQATRTTGGPRVIYPDLDYNAMHGLATAYFDTFNLLYPFMDRQDFISDTLARVHTEGFNGDIDSVIALLVFALGELALQGMRGDPISAFHGRPSGLRGGTLERPPGLALFNEARKRVGFVVAACELENVQIFSLLALYYGACSRYVEFWRLSVAASMTCHALITCNSIDWQSQRGDLVKRAYWHCVTMETGLHLDLDLPLTAIISIEQSVELPNFSGPFCEADHRCNEETQFQQHYASQLSLRRLCASLHNDINESMSITTDTPATSTEDSSGPTANNLKQLALQIEDWRRLLPLQLQWPDDDPLVFSQSTKISRSYLPPLDPSLSGPSANRPAPSIFSADLDRDPPQYPYAYGIQVATMRTRYYYAKYMVYRPFIYKALHFPDQMTPIDNEGVAECLKSCLKWPITFSPVSRQKRVVPYLFSWSQNFLGILLILHLSRTTPSLREVREQLGDQFEADAAISIDLMLDWLRDLKNSDPIAAWCCHWLSGIYEV